jgi:hypothetical protein
MNYIFANNIHILYRVLSKVWKQLSNCLKREEISVVFIISEYALCQVRAYKFTWTTKGPCELLPSLGVRRLSSSVSKLFTFQASSPKPLEPNLAGMFLGWSSTKCLFFVKFGYSTCLPGPIICSDWLKFQRSSSLKLMNWLKPNCKWMIIGISFTKFLFFMLIRNPRWPPPQDID